MKAIKIYLRPKGCVLIISMIFMVLLSVLSIGMVPGHVTALKSKKNTNKDARYSGVVLVVSMFIVAIIAVWSVSLFAISNTNAQVAYNHKKVDNALSAAQSGLEVAKYIAAQTSENLGETMTNTVSDDEANDVWNALGDKIVELGIGGVAVTRSSELITVSSLNFASGEDFTLNFSRSDPRTIMVQSIGNNGDDISRTVSMDLSITKASDVLQYAIASRGRMWLTGDSTIYGDIFSDWDRPEISPFNITSDSSVIGTVNTVLSLSDITDEGYQLETLDEYGNALDNDGNFLGTNYEDRYYSEDDEIQGYHENVNYEQSGDNMPGMDIADYDTSGYKDWVMYDGGNGIIPQSSVREYEYFPHAADNYAVRSSSSSLQLNRYVYENETFTDQRLPGGRNAVFKNCTFEGILYIDTYSYDNYVCNNVRFDDCQFNGPIITSTPSNLDWRRNCLYFTGSATFQNIAMEEATILAPHFNVDLGNTNPVEGESNELTGAVIGGIVDVRGNAQINGTIISMCDTTGWSSGFVTNIGATLDDGGSETTSLGDVGVISITPDEDRMLPSGITTPIVIKPDISSYSESI